MSPTACRTRPSAALYPALIAARPGSVRVFRTRREFLDIGTPADYLNTSLLLAGSARARACDTAAACPDRRRGARVERSILWDDVVVEEGAMLKECVVTDGVRVPADTSWHGVTLRVRRRRARAWRAAHRRPGDCMRSGVVWSDADPA